jgi:hypothetical protein
LTKRITNGQPRSGMNLVRETDLSEKQKAKSKKQKAGWLLCFFYGRNLRKLFPSNEFSFKLYTSFLLFAFCF